MPVFEQGVFEMLNGVKQNEKKVQDLKKVFEKNVIETMNKNLSKHTEFYTLVEKISRQLE